MLTDFLQTQAALYASGAMATQEREDFELILEFHEELRASVAALSEVNRAISLAAPHDTHEVVSPTLKTRITNLISDLPQQTQAEAMVATGADGHVQWINPAFSAMCGYTQAELAGKKLGPILQGPATERAAVERLRQGVRSRQRCRETILNYHKDGSPYWVDIAITPIVDDAGQPLWFVAREREVTAPPMS